MGKLPKYMDKVVSELEGKDVNPGILEPGVLHITVQHDDWCNLLNGRGDCNCDPDIKLGKPDDERNEVRTDIVILK